MFTLKMAAADISSITSMTLMKVSCSMLLITI